MTACETPASRPDAGNAPTMRIAVMQGALPDDWHAIYERLDRMPRRLSSLLLNAAATWATFMGLFAVAGAMVAVVLKLMPDISPYFLAGSAILPGLLGGAAAGQAGGNLFFRIWYRLDDATRRGFAARLTLARCPRDWPAPMRRWLFTGDWLGAPSSNPQLPYMRVFIKGPAPTTCRDEDLLWREIHGRISGEDDWEVGANVREASYPGDFPAWTLDVGLGGGYAELRNRIGEEEANAWVTHLWRRANRLWPALGANNDPGKARRECFEMHCLALADGRSALVVTLRPAAPADERLEAQVSPKRLAA